MYKTRSTSTFSVLLTFVCLQPLLGSIATSVRIQRSIFNTVIQQPFQQAVVIGRSAYSWVTNSIPRLLGHILKTVSSVPTIISNNISLEIIEEIVDEYSSGVDNEDVNLDIMQLIRKYGYLVEKHTVQTEDGYLLNIFRIPNNGSVVFLMHGLLSSADDWITPGLQSGIGYLLASEGFDVWMGNARGNKHSRRHVRLSASSPEFWDYSWHEIGQYDLPAMIEYTLNVTRKKQLKYVGHSQGTTSFFVMCSERPEYNNKISLMVALSAVAWMSNLKSPLIRTLSPLNPFLHYMMKSFGIYEFLPNTMIIKSFSSAMCGKKELAEIICSNIVFILCGYNRDQLNITNLPVYFNHLPSGASTKQLVHYGQEVVSGKFQRFDYGEKLNLKRYGFKYPPVYSIKNIITPVAIFYSENDWLASLTDVQFLKENLNNVVDFYQVPNKEFNHIDFIWAKDLKKLIFNRLLELLKKYVDKI